MVGGLPSKDHERYGSPDTIPSCDATCPEAGTCSGSACWRWKGEGKVSNENGIPGQSDPKADFGIAGRLRHMGGRVAAPADVTPIGLDA